MANLKDTTINGKLTLDNGGGGKIEDTYDEIIKGSLFYRSKCTKYRCIV